MAPWVLEEFHLSILSVSGGRISRPRLVSAGKVNPSPNLGDRMVVDPGRSRPDAPPTEWADGVKFGYH